MDGGEGQRNPGRTDDALRLLVPVTGIDGDARAHVLLLEVIGDAHLHASLLVFAAHLLAVEHEFYLRNLHW